MTFDLTNIWRLPYYIHKPSLVPIELHLFKWHQSSIFGLSYLWMFSVIQFILFISIFSLSYNLTSDNLWPSWHVTLGSRTYEGSHIISINQVWFQSDFNFSHEANFAKQSMQMSQISHFQAILQIDLTWPLTFICDFWPHEHVKVPKLYQ